MKKIALSFLALQLFAIHLRAQDDLTPVVENVTAAQVANTKNMEIFSILRSRMGSHVQSPSNGQ